MNCEELTKHGSEAALKKAGKYRVKGEDYVVKDGDVINFKWKEPEQEKK